MNPAELWIIAGIVAVFVALLTAIGWGMLQTRGLDCPAIDRGPITD